MSTALESAPAQTKISDYVSQLHSHDIVDSTSYGEDFKKETGFDPAWPEHSVQETVNAIKGRGLGGELNTDRDYRCAYGWEIAEGLAGKYANYGGSWKSGRGFRFRDALDALRKAGL